MSTVKATEARRFDAELLICRLEEAGAALLALPGTGWSTKLRGSSLEIVRSAIENYGWTTKRIRPPVPSAAQITRMDEAMAWISLIPLDRYRAATDRRCPQPGASDHRAAPIPLAPPRHRARC